MEPVTLQSLVARLQLAEQLLAERTRMFEPQDLPGRYGRVVAALDRLLHAIDCQAVVVGGWAVWRHGYIGRVTRDIDIVLPAAKVDAFLRGAPASGFQVLTVPPGRWPKLVHHDTDIDVDILPEDQRPGTPAQPAPTTIPHPNRLGASGTSLKYVPLPGLVELKLAAGRSQDLADVVKLIQANPDQLAAVREYLTGVHTDYVAQFDRLVRQARDEST